MCCVCSVVEGVQNEPGEERWKTLMGFKEGRNMISLHRVGRGSKEMS